MLFGAQPDNQHLPLHLKAFRLFFGFINRTPIAGLGEVGTVAITNAINAICQQKAQPFDRLFRIAEVLEVSIIDVINVDYKTDKRT